MFYTKHIYLDKEIENGLKTKEERKMAWTSYGTRYVMKEN